MVCNLQQMADAINCPFEICNFGWEMWKSFCLLLNRTKRSKAFLMKKLTKFVSKTKKNLRISFFQNPSILRLRIFFCQSENSNSQNSAVSVVWALCFVIGSVTTFPNFAVSETDCIYHFAVIQICTDRKATMLKIFSINQLGSLSIEEMLGGNECALSSKTSIGLTPPPFYSGKCVRVGSKNSKKQLSRRCQPTSDSDDGKIWDMSNLFSMANCDSQSSWQ